jgi:4-amino-4-deoxy-L-arabinose transferase-like glycosyltransferase
MDHSEQSTERPGYGSLLKRTNLKYLLFGIAAACLVLFATATWGIAVEYDSVFYFSASENWLAGNGLYWPLGGDELEPLTHYPPLYPVLLAAPGVLGIEPEVAARALSALLFGSLAALAGWFLERETGSAWTGLATSSLVVVSPLLLGVHLSAMTEPLFLTLLLLWLIFMMRSLETGSWNMVVLSAAAAGLAFYTRYIGVSLVIAGSVILLVFKPGLWRKRIPQAAGFILISALPALSWIARNQIVSGNITNRSLSFHPPTAIWMTAAASTFSLWLLPDGVNFRLRLLIFTAVVLITVLALLLVIIRAWKEGRALLFRTNPPVRLAASAALFSAVYPLMLLFSLTFIDASTRLDARILSPVYLAGLLIAVPVAAHHISTARTPWIGRAAAGVSVLLLLSFTLRSANLVREMRAVGAGFTGREWQNVEIIRAFQEKDLGGLVYSTEPLPLYYLTGRPAYWVPRPRNPVQAAGVEDYPGQLEVMRERLRTPGSMLVILYQSFYHGELAPPETFTGGLIEWVETDDGAIFLDPVNDP